MKGKFLFVVGLTAGYVLGARAGRKRYDQIASAASGVWNAPLVQKGVNSAKEFTYSKVGDASDALFDKAKSVVSSAARAGGKNAASAKKAASDAAASAKVAVAKASDAATDAIDAVAAEAAGKKKSTSGKTGTTSED